ncbi:MAG: pilin, partial [Wenzhouxiangella sp.]
MQNKPSHQGFTLVELMLILAVLGILMAIAVPAYQNYTIRSKVSECLSMANSAQTAVGFRRQVLGRFPGNDAEAQFEFNGGRFCEDIQIAEGGTIQMFTRNTGAAIDPIIQLTPDSAVASFNWNCELLDGSPSHVPSLCRNPGVPAPVGGGNPGSGNPGSGNPGSGNPGSGNPGSGNPGSGNPGSGNPGSGNPGSGNPGSGNPGSGNPGSGNPGSGNPGSGNPGSGNPGSGNPGSGNPGSGNPGSGNPGSGNPGSGNPG